MFDSACFASVFKVSDFRKLRKPNAFFDIFLASACFASVFKGLDFRKPRKPIAFLHFLLVLHVSLKFFKVRIPRFSQVWIRKNWQETCRIEKTYKKAFGFLDFLQSDPLKTEAKHA